jgi:hypothetical protein
MTTETYGKCCTCIYISRERAFSEAEGEKSEAQAKEDIKWRAIINPPQAKSKTT